jgi:hypothetical protein
MTDKERRIRDKISSGGRVFIPLWRIAQIKWEEAVARSQNKRARRPIKDVQFTHWDCTCGSIGCIANPRISGR